MTKQAKPKTDRVVEFIRLDKRLPDPKAATAGSAGIDLCVCSFDDMKLQGRASIPPGGMFKIGTGVKMHIGSNLTGLVGMVFPRSSLGKRGLALQNTVGIIDEDYQGEIVLLCRNMHRQVLILDPLERVAQMVIVPVMFMGMKEVQEFRPTERGAGGFGSTGK